MRRLRVRPGMTGLWQVSGRSTLNWEQTVRLDLWDSPTKAARARIGEQAERLAAHRRVGLKEVVEE